MKSLEAYYTDVIVQEQESRLKRLKNKAKKKVKGAANAKKKFWRDAWSTF